MPQRPVFCRGGGDCPGVGVGILGCPGSGDGGWASVTTDCPEIRVSGFSTLPGEGCVPPSVPLCPVLVAVLSPQGSGSALAGAVLPCAPRWGNQGPGRVARSAWPCSRAREKHRPGPRPGPLPGVGAPRDPFPFHFLFSPPPQTLPAADQPGIYGEEGGPLSAAAACIAAAPAAEAPRLRPSPLPSPAHGPRRPARGRLCRLSPLPPSRTRRTPMG